MSQPDPAGAKSSSFDKFAETTSEETAKTAFQLAWGIVKKLGLTAWEKTLVQKAMSQYVQTYNDRHGQVKLFGASSPIPLHHLYTEAQIVRPDFLNCFTDPDKMEADFRQAGRQHAAFQSKTERLDSIQVANENQFFNLLGAPGAGKSTFLAQLGQRALFGRTAEGQAWQEIRGKTQYQHNKLPVLFELRRFKSEPINLFKAVVNEFATCGFPQSEKFVQGALKEGDLLVLLDGLDEVPDAKLTEVVEHVRDFVDRYSRPGKEGNRFVISCRTAHYKSFFRKFTDVILADFSDEQIEQFARNRFNRSDDLNDQTAERFLAELRRPEHAGSFELARSPLLLGFLCVTFDHTQELPATRGKLYQRALDILLREWSASKRVHDEPAYKELNTDLELDMLAEMAESLFREDRFFFNREWAKKSIRSFMENVLSAPKSLDAEQILTAIEVHQGLIVKRAQDSYSFSHLTIQEYLTAKKLRESSDAWTRAVEDHLFDERWAVVFELMTGFGKADDLLLKMAARCQQELTNAGGAFTELLAWVNGHLRIREVSTVLEAEEVASARALVLATGISLAITGDSRLFSFAGDHYDSAVIVPRSLAHLLMGIETHKPGLHFALATGVSWTLVIAAGEPPFRALPVSVALAEAFGNLSPGISEILKPDKRQVLKSIAESLDKTAEFQGSKNSLKLARSMLSLPNDLTIGTLKLLSDILDCFLLIIRCKKAAYNVSPKVWQKICLKMLVPPEETTEGSTK